MNFKNINMGNLIHQRAKECGIDSDRISNDLNLPQAEIEMIYKSETIDVNILLKISKLLEYDFFRIYTEYLILHAPQRKTKNVISKRKKTESIVFRKNIYTKEIIDFILELLESKVKTEAEITNVYRIPKTTLCKWLIKRRGINSHES